jgi:hypothetical protein
MAAKKKSTAKKKVAEIEYRYLLINECSNASDEILLFDSKQEVVAHIQEEVEESYYDESDVPDESNYKVFKVLPDCETPVFEKEISVDVNL